MISVYDFSQGQLLLNYPEFAAQSYDIDDHIAYLSHEEREEYYKEFGWKIIQSLSANIPISGHYDASAHVGAGDEGYVRAVDTYNPRYETSFKTWATLIIRQRIIENARRLAREWGLFERFDQTTNDLSLEDDVVWSGLIAVCEQGVEDELAKKEIVECVITCINDLSERRRNILLRTTEGLNPYNAEHHAERQEDIAADFGVSQALISKILIQAREDLKLMLRSRYNITISDILEVRRLSDGFASNAVLPTNSICSTV